MVISIENKAVHIVLSFVAGNILFSAYYCVLVEWTVNCCILRGRGEERALDVVPRGTELELKTGSWAGRTHSQ